MSCDMIVCDLPAAPLEIVLFYLKPSEQIALFDVEKRAELTSYASGAWKWWERYAQEIYPTVSFQPTCLSPYARILELLARNDGVDRGCEDYLPLQEHRCCTYGTLIVRAMHEEDIPLMEYFLREAYQRSYRVVQEYPITGFFRAYTRRKEILSLLRTYGLSEEDEDMANAFHAYYANKLVDLYEILREQKNTTIITALYIEAFHRDNLSFMRTLDRDFGHRYDSTLFRIAFRNGKGEIFSYLSDIPVYKEKKEEIYAQALLWGEKQFAAYIRERWG